MIFVPHDYQKYTIQRIIDEPEIGIFLDMGLGKTVSTLTAIQDLKYNRFEIGKTLIICPKRVAESVWSNEQKKWEHLKQLRVQVVTGTEKQRIAALNTPADIYTLARDNTQWLVDYYMSAMPFDVLVLDESTSFKNHQSKRFKVLKAVRHLFKRVIALTGSVVSNGYLDLWAQMYLIDKGVRLGTRYRDYRERYFEPDARSNFQIFSWRLKQGSEESIQQKINDIAISMKASDYLTLPDCISVTVPVALDTKANEAYKKLEANMILKVKDDTIDAATAAVLGNKLLQLCNGAIYDENRKVIEVHSAKIDALLETLEALEGHPVLVFYNYQHDRDRIKSALSKTKLRVSELKTPEDEQAWNMKEIDVLLAHPASTAYGLNLQDGGNHVIWFSALWSMELYTQANARLHRQGQTQKVIIHHLIVTGGLDENVMTALEGKMNVQERLLLALKARIGGNGKWQARENLEGMH